MTRNFVSATQFPSDVCVQMAKAGKPDRLFFSGEFQDIPIEIGSRKIVSKVKWELENTTTRDGLYEDYARCWEPLVNSGPVNCRERIVRIECLTENESYIRRVCLGANPPCLYSGPVG